LFVNNGPLRSAGRPRWVSSIKRYVDSSAKNDLAFLLPRSLLRATLGGFGVEEKRFPLGIGYLSAVLKENGHEVSIIDRYAFP